MNTWARRLLLTAAIALVPLAIVGCGDDDDASSEASAQSPYSGKVLTFGMVPAEDAERALDDAANLERYLEAELPGLEVELFIGPSYAATIEAMKSGKVDFAYYGPFSYYIARSVGAGAVAALAFQEGDSPPGYYSILYARNDSEVTSLDQLAGREGEFKYALVDPGSTSGNLAPHAMLYEADLDVATITENLTYAGGHDKSAIATAAGQTQIGASYEGMLYDLCARGDVPGVKDVAGGGQFSGDCGDTEDPGALVLLEKFLLPASPISYRDTMDEELAHAVIDAMLRWHERDPEGYAKFAELTEGTEDTESRLIRYGPENFTQIEQMCSRPELADICPK